VVLSPLETYKSIGIILIANMVEHSKFGACFNERITGTIYKMQESIAFFLPSGQIGEWCSSASSFSHSSFPQTC
jgi:hypothetical protein